MAQRDSGPRASSASPSSAVAVFGGSFNPPHVAHVMAVAYVLACTDVGRVLVVPCYRHPFSKVLAPFEDRLAMCHLAFADLARVEVSPVEAELGGESLTVRTLEYLHGLHPDWSMRLIVGGDVVHELDRWTRPDRIRTLAPPLVLPRAGIELAHDIALAPAILPDISSTGIRRALGRGESVEALVPRTVRAYIEDRALYSRGAGPTK